jgi:opacity protein-like surface antigen
MKKLALWLVVVLVLVSSVSALALDQKGRFAIGGYGGYAMGFGDAFKKYDYSGYSEQFKTTFCLGGKVKYGLTPNIAIAGAGEYQGEKFESKGSIKETDNYHWFTIMVNGVYVFTPEKKICPYVTAGAGTYIPSEKKAARKPGINAGVGMEYFFQSNLALDAAGKFHMIFTKTKKTTYAQLLVGLTYYIGQSKGK